MNSAVRKIYWAGGLFDQKELTGNLLLGGAVEAESQGRYQVIFPQNSDIQSDCNGVHIRNADLLRVAQCDVIVANFDGMELDSGTVVEFCVAKMLDIPVLLLRSDFRNAGDIKGFPWNLMCAGWSRTKSLWLSSMAMYQAHLRNGEDASAVVAAWHREIAGKIVADLDEVCGQPPWLSRDEALGQYRRFVRSASSELEELLPLERLEEIVNSKIAKGLL